MVGTMNRESDERTWTKTDGEDAARLLAEMVQRARKTSGESPDKLQNPGESLPGERAGSRGNTGEAMPQGSPQVTVALSRGGGSDGLEAMGTYRVGGEALVANDNHQAALASTS